MPTGYFLLNVELNQELNVINKIKSILQTEDSITFDIQGVFGIYDIILRITSETDDALRNLALEKVKSIEKIKSIVTMMVNEA